MKIVIIGGVAAGPKAASRIIRLHPKAEVTIIEKGEFLSYAGCGLPYYISGAVKTQEELMATPIGVVRDSVFFQNVKNVKVLNKSTAKHIDRKNKTVTVEGHNGEEFILPYDKLVLATGADPIMPPLPGIKLGNVFKLKGVEDAESIKKMITERKALDIVIIGGGLIGVEVTESLVKCGNRVAIVEMLPHILPMMDPDMSRLVEKHFRANGVKVLSGTKVLALEGDGKIVKKVKTDRGELPAEMVIVSTGVRPKTELAVDSGIEIGPTRAIKVNEQMRTSDPDIYAIGDCAEKKHIITGKACFIPLGSTANKEGRVAANAICGLEDKFPGVLGSLVCRVFDFNVAKTGLNEKECADNGYEIVISIMPSHDKAHFMPESKIMILKLIADAKTGKLLGAQAVGEGEGDKRVDIAATAISAGMTITQISNLDLCYAPPYAPAMDNIIVAANIIRNKLDALMEGICVKELMSLINTEKAPILLDVRNLSELEKVKIKGAVNIPLGQLRKRTTELDPKKPIAVFCKISLRGYEAALILKNAGFKDVKVIDGGVLMFPDEILIP